MAPFCQFALQYLRQSVTSVYLLSDKKSVICCKHSVNSEKSREASPAAEQHNYLISQPDGSSDEEQIGDISGEDYKNTCEYLKAKQTTSLENERLPLPDLDKPIASTVGGTDIKTTVCLSDYQKDEQAKLSALEKHVKVTALPTGRKINGKHIEYVDDLVQMIDQ